MLPKTNKRLASTTLKQLCNVSRLASTQVNTQVEKHTLHEQWQESDEEHQEDRNNTVLDPIEHWDEVVAARLSRKNVALRVNLADGQLLVECSEV